MNDFDRRPGAIDDPGLKGGIEPDLDAMPGNRADDAGGPSQPAAAELDVVRMGADGHHRAAGVARAEGTRDRLHYDDGLVQDMHGVETLVHAAARNCGAVGFWKRMARLRGPQLSSRSIPASPGMKGCGPHCG